jgi:RNA polymerase sigma-70 factor, ECF subfamily
LAGEPRSDKDLLGRFLEGDEDSFATLMRRHEDRIFGLAYRITGDRADALEATQETFTSLFRSAANFKGDSELGTWLYRIGLNAARDVVRRRRRAPVPEGAPEQLDLHRPAVAATDDAVAARLDVARALAALPEDYREAVVMHDIGGIPYEEIARLTGVAIGTVKSRISRGRRMLARHLEQPAKARASKDST